MQNLPKRLKNKQRNLKKNKAKLNKLKLKNPNRQVNQNLLKR